MVTRGKLYADEIYVYVRNKAGAYENVWKDAYTTDMPMSKETCKMSVDCNTTHKHTNKHTKDAYTIDMPMSKETCKMSVLTNLKDPYVLIHNKAGVYENMWKYVTICEND